MKMCKETCRYFKGFSVKKISKTSIFVLVISWHRDLQME